MTLGSQSKLQSCTCPDRRIRKRNCKHIHMVWRSIGIEEDSYEQWRGAVDAAVSASALDVAEEDSEEDGASEEESEGEPAPTKAAAGEWQCSPRRRWC